MSRARWPRLAPRPIGLSVLVGVTVALVISGWAGVLGGAVAAVVCHRWLARQATGSHIVEQRQARADLPFAADLLGAALRAGAPPDVAAHCVGHAISGPLSDRLGRVGRALRLGAPAAEAWAYLGDTEGAQRMARAATRSQHSGAAFAGSLQRVADDLRSDLLVEADAEARRAGVLIVLPLGLCFLPAFVLAGLVPVMVAILGDVLSR
jgi:pilus assembly protein TadC